MSETRTPVMGIVTTFLKALFIILFGLVAIGLVLYSAWIFPNPASFVFGGTGLIVILMLGTAWIMEPGRSIPR